MIRRAIAVAASSMLLSVVGCGMMGGSKATPSTDPSATTMPMASDRQSLMDQANALLKKGQDLLAKGKADNSADEQTQGQSMIDQAEALLAKYKSM